MSPRSPDRIERILALIAEIWNDSPDLRLGQLLANASQGMEKRLFYYEDDKLETELLYFKQVIESYGPRERHDGNP